jgi:hypothetical protein
MSANGDGTMKWEVLEAWLFETHTLGGQFTSFDVADALGCSGPQASGYIQSYLDAQRSSSSRTLYVLHRDGRTSAALWSAGIRTADARAVSHTYFEDVKTKWRRAVEPDLIRIAQRNPQARKKCDRIIDAVGDHAMQLLRIAVDGFDDNDDEGGSPVK